jgi:hypothetical protein
VQRQKLNLLQENQMEQMRYRQNIDGIIIYVGGVT